jgi:hypothetical protein
VGYENPSRRGPKIDKIDRSQFEEPIDLDDLESSVRLASLAGQPGRNGVLLGCAPRNYLLGMGAD